ncbi:MAG: lyase family protein, partial [Gemmatimonadales bacterium]
EALLDLITWLPFRGCKGSTGTQASFLELFDGDHGRVRKLDQVVTAAFGFSRSMPVTGQTYTRKVDARVLDVLSGLAQSCAKLGNDLRLLQHEGEILEPAEASQVGSSAMPYKRNPMRAERLGALARYLISLQANPAYTAATQWLERTLDDSANRRMTLPDAFLAADALLLLAGNIARGLEVREGTVQRNVERVMPFMATERWLMLGVRAGGDRQTLHEVIRGHAWAVAEVLDRGGANDLLDHLAADPAFAAVGAQALRAELDATRYVGRAPAQVQEFLAETIDPLLQRLQPFPLTDDAGVTV